MKKFLVLIVIALNLMHVNAQNSNVIAQGYYFKAKSQFNERDYSKAVRYAQKSISALGGTNLELQYLMIMSYAKAEEWIRAEKELKTYTKVENFSSDVTIKDFDDTVPSIIKAQKQNLAKIMVDIIEQADKLRQKAEAAKNYNTSPEYTRDTLITRVNNLFKQLVTFNSDLENDKVNHSITIKKLPQKFKYSVIAKLYSKSKRSKGHDVYNCSVNLYDLNLDMDSPISVTTNAEEKYINIGSGDDVEIKKVFTKSDLNISFTFKNMVQVKRIFYGSKTEYYKGKTDNIVLPATRQMEEAKAKQLAEDLCNSLKELKEHIKKHNFKL